MDEAPIEQIQNLIGGGMVSARSGATLDVYEPATGRVHAQMPRSNAEDVGRAVDAATAAFESWRLTSPAERALWLDVLANALEKNLQTFAEAESRDTGKPLSVALAVDIPRAIANLRFFADAASQFSSESHHMNGAINYTLRHPHGVVACITPWNLPLYLLTWKLGPALAAGNTIVAKPSEVTPLTAHLLARLIQACEFPAGVINIVYGTGQEVGFPLTDHPDVRAISFTGGTETGARIASVAAPQFKKLSLELGGKNPSIVFADADLTRTVPETVRAAFSNQGQICLCGSRVLVQREIYQQFRDAFVAEVEQMQPADPDHESCRMGALVSEEHMRKVLSAIERARAEGGRILTGGERATIEGRCADGWFVQPTVVEGLDPGCATNQEEIFGPVASLIPFDDEDEAMAIANGVRYGLAASLWTQDLSRAHRMADRLEAGLIWVNCWMLRDLRVPMGGMKDSGVGREGGLEAMRFFTEPRNVCIRYG